eukprot:m.29039 g.29039  ORF g.29039 m.29039 type:complete len:50 (+) comp10495_c2_seq2:1995-2144(+)
MRPWLKALACLSSLGRQTKTEERSKDQNDRSKQQDDGDEEGEEMKKVKR